jgi:hypothetical protein
MLKVVLQCLDMEILPVFSGSRYLPNLKITIEQRPWGSGLYQGGRPPMAVEAVVYIRGTSTSLLPVERIIYLYKPRIPNKVSANVETYLEVDRTIPMDSIGV